MPIEQQQSLNPQMSPAPSPASTATPASQHVPEKYLIAFVIQGEDVFKITADNIIHTTGTADGPAFDAIAKLKAAAALLELTNRHKERPEEIKKMARELAGEGMKMMAYASSSIRAAQPPATPELEEAETQALAETQARPEPVAAPRVAATATPEAVRPQGPAPVPKPQDRSVDDFFNPSANSRISLISS